MGDKRGLALSAIAGLVFVLMFLPWVEVSCGGQPLLSQNGYQVVAGTTTVADETDPAAIRRERENDETKAAWWLALALLGTAGAGFQGVRMTTDARAARPAFWGALFAAAVLSISLAFGLPAERRVSRARGDLTERARDKEPTDEVGAALASVLQSERRPGLWLTLSAMWVQVAVAAFLIYVRPAPTARRERAVGEGRRSAHA